jgi:serine/tyrosine/threonine adenylyltransferase
LNPLALTVLTPETKDLKTPSSPLALDGLPLFRWRSRLTEALRPPFYAWVEPTPLTQSRLLHWNASLSQTLGLGLFSVDRSVETPLSKLLSGSWKVSSKPESALEESVVSPGGALPLATYATVYSGHQFGVYVPQLGDGRAIFLGEHSAPNGDVWEVQLKGAGKTPYSRLGDGRAVLRSSLREYVASEAMHALGIPTTRALALVASPTPVYREKVETAAVLTRVAPSFLRFGHVEFLSHTQQTDLLKDLLAFLIETQFPALSNHPFEEQLGLWFHELCRRTAGLMVQWQSVGFCHGVMNTDNLSLLGLTLDYGPYGFLETFDPAHLCNHSDSEGRYAYFRQPDMALWNLDRLAFALKPLMPIETLESGLQTYLVTYHETFRSAYLQKLGLDAARLEREAADRLLKGLFRWMTDHQHDPTRFFRALADFTREPDKTLLLQRAAVPTYIESQWLEFYQRQLQETPLHDEAQKRYEAMLGVNPRLVPRNWLLQVAIERAEQGDLCELDRLVAALSQPYAEHPQAWQDPYEESAPDWAKALHVSCSS